MNIKFGSVPSITGICLAIIFIAGCAGLETEINSISFHDGQAESNEKILLRNIIAAAHDKAPTFVAANQVSSTGELKSSLSATFTQLAMQGHTITPGLEGRRTQTVTILDYGATKAAKVLYNKVPPAIVRQLSVEGWPAELILTILYGGIQLPAILVREIRDSADRTCITSDIRHDVNLCAWNADIISRCDDPGFDVRIRTSEHEHFEDEHSEESDAPLLYPNNARNRCDFERFQVVLNYFSLSNTSFSFRERVIKDDKGNEITKIRFTLGSKDEKIVATYEEFRKRGVGVSLRSPKQIIDYLGRLAALQLFSDPPYVPKVLIPVERHSEWAVPFRVVRGRDLEGPSAVSVRAGTFERYYVPQPDPVAKGGDQSVKVMALVIELQNRARIEAPIQGTGIAILQ